MKQYHFICIKIDIREKDRKEKKVKDFQNNVIKKKIFYVVYHVLKNDYLSESRKKYVLFVLFVWPLVPQGLRNRPLVGMYY